MLFHHLVSKLMLPLFSLSLSLSLSLLACIETTRHGQRITSATLSSLCMHVCVCLYLAQSEAGKFSEAKSRFYFGEIILALEYLHGFEIVFR